ncbi:hypothetical protein A2X44_02440 [candidate division CPR3 bacterium GWF2_35_18]|nr:MAG: hypothetical protein A2X44_02440 [candidate division CPR3 bacterium GWF2_35_18]OGB65434.1 MAG: hypothetical protein A2250_00655 [candidate division CPR3 bacterium RIFOXYA2_FULL_35_13]OGB76194.1 MAG: hypothetical protein A2476_03705 [candidate division CPR3 bacterium RIFOXYC2_FULL_35_7]OGB78957.1 MAG: hypothetical protein A2296_03330 [candidate division CPR3 bacterium RIFOXYB2_FULL_35_8]OGB79768.1 MAG: hypothetical protein A2011_02985 [candidate division CPR3 bacterium GWE2_35_7]
MFLFPNWVKIIITICFHIIVWPIFFYGIGLIFWWTIPNKKQKEFLKKKFERGLKKVKGKFGIK